MTEADSLLSEAMVEDPYPMYHQLRSEDPVHFIEPLNSWILTRISDVRDAFADDMFGVQFEQYQINRAGPDVVNQDYFRVAKDSLVCNDPPVHTDLRKVFRRAFTMRRVRELVPRIQEICRKQVDTFIDAGRADIVGQYSYMVPLAVISSMLDVPESDQPQIAEWVANWSPVLEISPLDADTLDTINTATVGLENYFHTLLERRRKYPGNDFVSEVIALNAESDEPLGDAQIVANLLLLYFAGQDTQRLMFGNIASALDKHRGELQKLQNRPELINDCMHELYRYDTVGQFMGRTTEREYEFRGKTIYPGQTVMVCMGAANRDPAAFSNPDVLDLGRRESSDPALRNVTFGYGRHHCLGSHLAQTNIPIMLREVVSRLTNLRVDYSESIRHNSIATRGYDTLVIEWDR